MVDSFPLLLNLFQQSIPSDIVFSFFPMFPNSKKLHILRRIFAASAKGCDVIHLIAGRRALKSMLAQESCYLSTGTLRFRFRCGTEK